ncbi:MAG: glutaredoxin family protein [bacterium]
METKFKFIEEDGTKCKNELVVYALSTCGFCHRALKFLKEHSFKFKYVYYDELEPEVQEQIEKQLRDQFNRSLSFPFLVIDCKRFLIGFNQDKWEEELL